MVGQIDEELPEHGPLRYWAEEATPWRREYYATYGSLEGLDCSAAMDLAEHEDLASLVVAFDVSDQAEEDGLAAAVAQRRTAWEAAWLLEHPAGGTEAMDADWAAWEADLAPADPAWLPAALPRVLLLPYFWVPSEGLDKKSDRHRLPYRQLARDKYIEIQGGPVLQQWQIMARVMQYAERWGFQTVCYDPFNALAVAGKMAEEGLDMLRFQQNYTSFSEPTKRLLAGLASGEVVHTGHPILGAHALNLSISTDANGNQRPIKEKRGSPRKVDGMVAAIMAYMPQMAPGDDGGGLHVGAV